MSGNFVKLYGSILDSSIWSEAQGTKLLWITMLAMADEEGNVEASVGGLAKRAGISREQCDVGLAVLLSPDPDDRSGVEEGRRLREIPGGWHIINAQRYREKRSPQQIKGAARVQKHRERKRGADVFDPRSVPVPASLDTPGFRAAFEEFIEYRRRSLGKPWRTELGVTAAFRHLIPLGAQRAIEALRITREKEWQGVEHGVTELLRRESRAQYEAPRSSGGAPPAQASRTELELERRRIVEKAFALDLAVEERDSIIDAANRATCLEDLARILWPI